jgi:gas vesicle protein
MAAENNVERKEDQKNNKMGSPVNRTILGGVLGATIGLVSSPKAKKKILEAVDTEKIKEKGVTFGKTAKEKLTELKDTGVEKSQNTAKEIKKKTTDFMNKRKNNGEDETQGKNEEAKNENEQTDNESYQSLKEQNKKLSDRVEQLEQKLQQLLDSKDSDNQEKENGSKSPESSHSETTVSNNDDTSSK